MVDFRFDIRPLFPQAIIKVTSNLLPHTFRGDRRQCLDATSKMTEIIDRLGQLSATSQGLSKPVTTGQRLRMSENQTVYLLADLDAGHNGQVVGLLKVGTKDLYLYDETGQTRKVEQAPSILDFYIHESRQRSGLGNRLFQTMLSEEQWTPVKCSVDRPSDKLLAFLGKHYGLTRSIPQANNFVLFEGFFDEAPSANGHGNHAQSPQHTRNGGLHITNSPNTQLFGATYLGEDHRRRGSQQHQAVPNHLLEQVTQISPHGRYGARRPTCSMAESRHAGGGGGAGAAPIGRKVASEVSITPSQSRNQDPRKSPLDALSRSGIQRQQNPFQRRSGLQDVDDSFLAANAFARPPRVRHSGLERESQPVVMPAPVRMAGGQEPMQQQQQYQQMPPAGGESQQQQMPPVAAVPSAQQIMQQYAQQPAAGQPTRHEPMPSGRAHVHHQHMQQQQQQQQQVPQQQVQQQQVPQQQVQQQTPVYEQQQPVATTPEAQNQNRYPPQQQQQPQQTQQGYIIHAGNARSGKGGGGNSAESNSGMLNRDLAEITAQLHQQDLEDIEAHRYIPEPQHEPEPEEEPEPEPEPEVITPPSPPPKSHTPTPPSVRSPEVAESIIGQNRRPPAFQLSKQHTGMKNRSFGVGGAVMPSSKMEFDQMEREDFGVVKINRPPGHDVISPGHDNTDALSTASSGGGGGLTDQGYNDLKFYHNKLW